MFKKRENVEEIEEGNLLSPKFDNDGLIPVITMCSKPKDVLMHGYMNIEAFKKTIETKEAHYFSRSRKAIWHKGKTSGFTQKVTELRIDDDQDSVWMTVDGYDDMVIQKNISIQSHCEHHMAPIIGKAHVAYIPKERVVGLSKLARVVEVFSKRLQTQERLTMQVAKTLMESLDAKGVAVTIDSTHQCMTMRGIKKEHASTVTNYYLGQFKEDLSFQNRYLRFISIAKD